MKEQLFGNSQNGFSTIEIVVALAIMVIALSGAASANFAAEYWSIASETSSEALSKTKTNLEDLRAVARRDFYQASSSPPSSVGCVSGQLCYFTQNTVIDVSPCAKYLQAEVSFRVRGYPTTTTMLSTGLTNIPEIAALGGDCSVEEPKGNWEHISAPSSLDFTPGNPTGIDVLDGTVVITEDRPPWLRVASSASSLFTDICSGCIGPYNAVDVARDISGDRVYAFVAATTTKQLQIIDITDRAHPSLVSSAPLSGPSVQAWRIAYYDKSVYITSRYIIGSSPEFHVFDVSDPFHPVEKGRKNLDTSPYDVVVREQMIGSSFRRFAYLATTHDLKEVMILDVTNPASLGTPVSLDLPEGGCLLSDSPDATVLSLLGTTLWVGREHSRSCDTLPDLYSVDVSDPLHPFILSEIRVGSTITGLHVSGSRAYIETAHTASAPGTGLLDVDGEYVYALRSGKSVEVWNIELSDTKKLSSSSPLSHSLQIFYAP